MGYCCSKVQNSVVSTEEEVLLAQPEQEVINDTGYQYMSIDDSKPEGEEERFQRIIDETTNSLINIRNENFMFDTSMPIKEVSTSYKKMLEEFDKQTDMSEYFPKERVVKYNADGGANDFDIVKVLLAKVNEDDIKLINEASKNIADILDNYKLEYSGEFFVPLGMERHELEEYENIRKESLGWENLGIHEQQGYTGRNGERYEEEGRGVLDVDYEDEEGYTKDRYLA